MDGLGDLIGEWRARMLWGDAMDPDTVRELESHLRDAVKAHVANGMPTGIAFAKAEQEIGDVALLNAEFGKVHPRAPWARRVVWLISGYVIVCFALSIGDLIFKATADLVEVIVPEARLQIPVVSEILFGHNPPSGRGLTVSSLVAAGIRLLFLLSLCVMGIRWLRRKTPRLARSLSAGGSAIRLVLLLGMIAWLSLGPGHYVAAQSQAFPFERLARILLFAIAIAVAAVSRDRDRAGGFEQRNYAFAGYFVVSGTLMLGNFLASIVGIVVTRIFPSSVDLWAPDFWPSHLQGLYSAYGVRVWVALPLMVTAFGIVLVSLCRRSHPRRRIASLIARRWSGFLIGWAVWTYSAILMGLYFNYQWLADPTQIGTDIGTSLAVMLPLDYSDILHKLLGIFLVILVLVAHLQVRLHRVRETGKRAGA